MGKLNFIVIIATVSTLGLMHRMDYANLSALDYAVIGSAVAMWSAYGYLTWRKAKRTR